MCGDSSGPLGPYSPLSAGLWLFQLTGSVSIVAYLMSWWTLPPADTGKVTEQYTSQPPPSLRPAASQPVCRNTAIINPASPLLAFHLIYMLFHIHTLHSLTYLLSVPWISSCDSLIYVHMVHSRSLILSFQSSHGKLIPLSSVFFSFLQLYFLNCVVSLYFFLHWPIEGLKCPAHVLDIPLQNLIPRFSSTLFHS